MPDPDNTQKTHEDVIAAIDHAIGNAVTFLRYAVDEYHRAVRLQALATVYAALHTAPRSKDKDNSIDAIARDAAAIVTALERQLR